MPIISKETWDKFTQEEKDKIKQAMKEIPNEKASVETLLIELFPAEALQPKPLTYEDVEKEMDYYYSDEMMEKEKAIHQMLLVTKFLNKDWKPDWENRGERKWYLSFNGNKINISYVIGDNSCIVYFRTEELANQAIQILGEDTVILALTTEY